MRRGLAVLAAATLLVFSGVAITQPPDKDGPAKEKKKGGKGFFGDPFVKAIKSLDLTDAQKPKVREIQEAHEQKLRELFKKMMDARKKLHDETMKDFKGVLTEKQLQTLDEALKKGFGPPPGKDKKGGPKDKKGPPDDKSAGLRPIQLRFAPMSFVAWTDRANALNEG